MGGAMSREPQTLSETSDPLFLYKEFPLTGYANGWLDSANVCNNIRLCVLLAELRRLGFECSVKAASSIVSRPTALTLHVGLRWVDESCAGGSMSVKLQDVDVYNGRL